MTTTAVLLFFSLLFILAIANDKFDSNQDQISNEQTLISRKFEHRPNYPDYRIHFPSSSDRKLRTTGSNSDNSENIYFGSNHQLSHTHELIAVHEVEKRFLQPSHLLDLSKKFEKLAADYVIKLHAGNLPKARNLDVVSVGSRCKLNNGASSKCVVLKECPSAVNDLIQRRIRPVRCGFKGREEIVCCPDYADTKPGRPYVGAGWDWGSTTDVFKPVSTPRPPPQMKTSTTKAPVTPKQTVNTSKQPMTTNVGAKSANACRKYQADSFPLLQPFIKNGEEAQLGEFPHMALLGYPEGTSNREGQLLNGSRSVFWRCGGTLISERFVMTAAHCVDGFGKPDPFVIRVGDLDWSTNNDGAEPEEVGVKNIAVHPNYRADAQYDDIALLELSRPVTFYHAVQPACLPEPVTRSKYLVDAPLTVTGWGDSEFAMDKTVPRLMKAELRGVDLETCGKSYAKEGKLKLGIISSHLCAQHIARSSDACVGDSGGPLQVRKAVPSPLYEVVGVVSAGKFCSGQSPTIFTKVADYVGWIESQVWP